MAMSGSFTYNYQLAPKLIPYEDIIEEVRSLSNIFALYERVRTAASNWKMDLEQNTAQMEILNEAASVLRRRHQLLTKLASTHQKNHQLLRRLNDELAALARQISVWVDEFAAISDDRRALRFKHMGHLSQLKKSITNIELAHLDFDRLDAAHGRKWNSFIEGRDSPVTTHSACPILVSGADGDIDFVS